MKTLALLMALGLGVVACGGARSKGSDVGDVGSVTGDTGTKPVTRTPVDRALVPRTFMGNISIANGFLSPSFDPASFPAWLNLADQKNSLVQLELPSTPSGLPVLELGQASPGSGAMAAGYAQGGPGPLKGSIWVGRPSAEAFDSYPAPKLGLYGIFPAALGAFETETEIDLTPVLGSDQTMSGIAWRKYQLNTPSALLGRGLLIIYGTPKLYVTGPLLQSTGVTSFADEPVSPLRAVTPEERALLQSIRERVTPRNVGPPSLPLGRVLQ